MQSNIPTISTTFQASSAIKHKQILTWTQKGVLTTARNANKPTALLSSMVELEAAILKGALPRACAKARKPQGHLESPEMF